MRGSAVVLACVAVLAWAPAGVQAEVKVWHVGLCHVGLDHEPPSLSTLHQALNQMGYRDGEKLHFDWRNQPDEAAAHVTAQSWVEAGVDLIVAFEDQCMRAAKAATSDIPIVMIHAHDPIAAGYIESLARPGGNITGPISSLDLIGKRLELLRQVDPELRRVLVLLDGNDPFTPRQLQAVRQAATALQVELIERDVRSAADLELAFAEVDRTEAGGVIVASPDLMTNHTNMIISLAEQANLPLAAHRGGWVELGALLSYAPDYAAAGPVAAKYIDRILNGASPAELPVEELSEVVLSINLRRAKELGLSIPPAVLLRADEVIE